MGAKYTDYIGIEIKQGLEKCIEKPQFEHHYFKTPDYPIIENNLVYTSGSGGIFKAGIPIGKIKSLNENNNRTVEFFSDFSQLRFVKIISFEKELNNE